MQCPNDGVTLDGTRVENAVDVEICPACGGMWLEPGELQRIEEVHAERVKRIPPEHDAMTVGLRMAHQKTKPPEPCPVCDTTMVREEYGLASGVIVDHCPEGHGMWLEKGELEEIEEFYARERAEARVPVLIQFLRNLGLSYD